jgi:hypothetical protein
MRAREKKQTRELFPSARMCVWLEGKLFLKPPIEFAVGKELAEGIYAVAQARESMCLCVALLLSALESLGPARHASDDDIK